ncbi:MAG: long-chain fatty acid--CoA ligase [Candidatus Competibacteraceae bacterium]|nr:long-chain fatty acid--CoA ligase [Candidatus Competibacteraceae bacterium]
MESTRLFDLLETHVSHRPHQSFLSAKVNQQWKNYSFAQVQDMANRVSHYLLHLGLKKEDKIAIISNNCPEWNFVDLGALQIGLIDVPMYPNISEKDYDFIFRDAGIQYAFVENEEIFSNVKPLLGNVPTLKAIYSFKEVEGINSLEKILNLEPDMTAIETHKADVSGNDIATIIYTSGTTGNPKGVMLTHENLLSNVSGVKSVISFEAGKRTLSFLPLCHSFERMVFYTYLSFGMHIHYAENLDSIGENLKEIKPFCFTTVPRLLEKVYEKIMAKGAELKGFKKKIFDWSITLGLAYQVGRNKNIFYRIKLSIARKLVFSKWQEALGGELKFIVTGAAAMQPRLITLFTAAGIQVIEGYGLTETSPVLTVNRMEERLRCIGTVGMPLPGVEIKMAEDGEILARGKNVMRGYYNRPDLTAEVIDNAGWFYTGDIGKWVEWNGEKFLQITDRKKELFKTAGGKYVAPQAIENKMKESRFIEQIVVVGGDDKKFVSALIVPSFVLLEEWANNNQLQISSTNDLINHNKTYQLIHEEIDKLNHDFGHWEQIKKFTILQEEWSVDSGELTPTMKPKRKIIYTRYASIIEKMYRE